MIISWFVASASSSSIEVILFGKEFFEGERLSLREERLEIQAFQIEDARVVDARKWSFSIDNAISFMVFYSFLILLPSSSFSFLYLLFFLLFLFSIFLLFLFSIFLQFFLSVKKFQMFVEDRNEVHTGFWVGTWHTLINGYMLRFHCFFSDSGIPSERRRVL